MHKEVTTIPLNRSELMYLALEGIVGSVSQVYALRFCEAHTEDELRAAVRHVVRIYPRMRSLIISTAFTHRLRVLPDDTLVDALFNEAFQVVRGVNTDSASLQQYLEEIADKLFDLEHALPLRARLLVDGPYSVLVFIVHHVVCDGRGMVKMMDSILAYLNGVEHREIPIDEPSMVPAVFPDSFNKRVRSFIRSYRIHRFEAKTIQHLRTIELGIPRPNFGRPGVRIHSVPFPIITIKRCATLRGCSVTELLIALLALGFARGAEQNKKNAVSIRLSVDLRPYFSEDRRPSYGNFVASFMIHVTRWDDIDALVADIHSQLRKNLQRFERKDMSYSLMMGEISSRIGRKLFAETTHAMKRRGTLPKTTFHFSKIGTIDMLNLHGTKAQLNQVNGFVTTMVPFITSWLIKDKLSFTCSYPSHEIDGGAIDQIFSDFDQALGDVVRTDTLSLQ